MHTVRLYMLQMCNGEKQTSRRELGFARGAGNCYLLLGAKGGHSAKRPDGKEEAEQMVS